MITNENDGAATLWNVAAALLGYGVLIFIVMLLTGADFSIGLPFTFIKAKHWVFPRWFSTSIGIVLALIVAAQMLNPFKVRNVYGGAHFANEKEIRDMGLRAPRGLILGMTVKTFCGWKWGNYLRVDQPLSVLLYAPPGTGKTTGVIIPSLLAEQGSCIVMDPKGEICDITRGVKSKTHTIIRFAPAETGSARWNPLSIDELPKSFEETQAYIGRIAESLIVGADNGSDQHWVESGRALFRFWCMFLIWRDGETSLGAVVKESVGGIEGAQAALNAALENHEAGMPEEIKTEGYKFSRMEGAQFDGVIGTLNTKTKLFGDKTIARNTSRSDFQFDELRKKPTALYFVVPINDMARMKPLISLFFELATNTFLGKLPDPGKKGKKGEETPPDQTITLYLDEFVQMGKMPNVIKMPAVGRGFRVRAVYILQSYSQLQSVYGDKEASALRNNCAYLVIFTQNEQKVAEDLSKSIGNRTRVKKSQSTSHTVTVMKGGSESEEGVPLVRVQDIMSMEKGTILLLVQGNYEKPIKAKAALYYKDKTMSRLLEGVNAHKLPTDEIPEQRREEDEELTLNWTLNTPKPAPAKQAAAALVVTGAAEGTTQGSLEHGQDEEEDTDQAETDLERLQEDSGEDEVDEAEFVGTLWSPAKPPELMEEAGVPCEEEEDVAEEIHVGPECLDEVKNLYDLAD